MKKVNCFNKILKWKTGSTFFYLTDDFSDVLLLENSNSLPLQTKNMYKST
jgi:hypothetical protein